MTFFWVALAAEAVFVTILIGVRQFLIDDPDFFRILIPGLIAIPALTDLLWRQFNTTKTEPAVVGGASPFRRSVRVRSLETKLRGLDRFLLLTLASAVVVGAGLLITVAAFALFMHDSLERSAFPPRCTLRVTLVRCGNRARVGTIQRHLLEQEQFKASEVHRAAARGAVPQPCFGVDYAART